MKPEGKAKFARRDFLHALGVGAGVAVAVIAPIASEALADTENNDEKRRARYKETDHVKAYYHVNQYPSR